MLNVKNRSIVQKICVHKVLYITLRLEKKLLYVEHTSSFLLVAPLRDTLFVVIVAALHCSS